MNNIITKVITLVIILLVYYRWNRGGLVAKRKINNGLAPENRTATEFLRGQASKIFYEVADQDKVVIVNKHSKPQSVITSYKRYIRLKYEEGVDI